MWVYNSERECFKTLHDEYISKVEDSSINCGIELMFIKNNSTTPQFVTTEKSPELYKRNALGDLELTNESFDFTATTNTAGYFKFSQVDYENKNLLCLIGDKPNTHTPNRAHNGFENNKGEQRRNLLELIYIGQKDLDDVALWYQQNRYAHPTYENMLNYHVHTHRMVKLGEYMKIIEYKFNMNDFDMYNEEDAENYLNIETENTNQLDIMEQMSFLLDSTDEDGNPLFLS